MARSKRGPVGQRPAPRPARRRRTKRLSRRPGIVFIGICLFAFASFLAWQLYQIQIKDHAVYAEKATGQHYKRIPEDPRRGSIFDRNGVELAGTTYVHQIGITPTDVCSITKNLTKEVIATGIAVSLELFPADIQEAMQQQEETYILLKKDVSREQAELLKEFLQENTIGGVRIDTETRRYNTNGTLASQIIGFCRYDEGLLVGQLGLELEYNELLTGQPGYTYVETDNYSSRGVLPFSVPTSLRAQNGLNLNLSIDINMQKIVQDELERAIELYDVQGGGQAIVMQPHTGAVLAMASWPYFSSSDPTACPPDQDEASWDDSTSEAIEYLSSNVWRNRAISDAYEPGSTMKSLTLAIALEEGLANEKTPVTCQPLNLYSWTINCVRRGGHGDESLEMGFWRSCNPVFAQLALNIGVGRFYTYMQAFGLTSTTGIDLPGESTGILHSNPTELDMATLSYGEYSTVTPLELATAFCTYANGGRIVQPSVVHSITDQSGLVVEETRPETQRQVISEQTAARVKELMKGVVLYGTGSPAYVEGYGIAGKTSTSTDDFGDHTLSFAALAPADNPELVVLIVLDKPLDRELTSKVAARACGQIISRTLEYMGVERVLSETDISSLAAKVEVPDLQGLTLAEALRTLADAGLRGEAGETGMADSASLAFQWPAAGTKLHKQGLVVLYSSPQPQQKQVSVPDFRGRTINECLTMAAESGLNILVDSSFLGVVSSQYPAPANLALPSDPDQEELEEPEEEDQTDSQPVLRKLKQGDLVRLTFTPVEEELAWSDENE